MGILITTDIEIFIHKVIQEKGNAPLILADEIICALYNNGMIREDVSFPREYSQMRELIQRVLEEPCYFENTPEQDLWRKARVIHHNLVNEKHRKNGFLKHIGCIYTTSGTNPV